MAFQSMTGFCAFAKPQSATASDAVTIVRNPKYLALAGVRELSMLGLLSRFRFATSHKSSMRTKLRLRHCRLIDRNVANRQCKQRQTKRPKKSLSNSWRIQEILA